YISLSQLLLLHNSSDVLRNNREDRAETSNQPFVFIEYLRNLTSKRTEKKYRITTVNDSKCSEFSTRSSHWNKSEPFPRKLRPILASRCEGKFPYLVRVKTPKLMQR